MGVITPSTISVVSGRQELTNLGHGDYYGAGPCYFNDSLYNTTVKFSSGGEYACEISCRLRNQGSSGRDTMSDGNFQSEDKYGYSTPCSASAPAWCIDDESLCHSKSDWQNAQSNWPRSTINRWGEPLKTQCLEMGYVYASFIGIRITTATNTHKWIVPNAQRASDNFIYSEKFTLTDAEAGNNASCRIDIYVTAPGGFHWSHNYPTRVRNLKLNFRPTKNLTVIPTQTSWTDSTLTLIKKVHIEEIRNAINRLDSYKDGISNCGYTNCCQSCQNSCIPPVCQEQCSCQATQCCECGGCG